MNKKTYILLRDGDEGTVGGYVSLSDALLQGIFLLLCTEGGAYEIYDTEYGVKRSDLSSARYPYAESMIKRRVRESIYRYFGDEVNVIGIEMNNIGGDVAAEVYIEKKQI